MAGLALLPLVFDARPGAGARSLSPRRGARLDQPSLLGDVAETAPAAGLGRLHEVGVTDDSRRRSPLVGIVAEGRAGGQDRRPGSLGGGAGGQLVAADPQRVG